MTAEAGFEPAYLAGKSWFSLAKIPLEIPPMRNPNIKWPNDDDLDCAYVPSAMVQLVGDGVPVMKALRDENRSGFLPDKRMIVAGQELVLNVKGCGSIMAPYELSTIDGATLAGIWRGDVQVQEKLRTLQSDGIITSEQWFSGESPYGGQGYENAVDSLRISELAGRGLHIEGFHICPVLQACILPRRYWNLARHLYWFRRHEGPICQTIRMMPSDVRLYFHGSTTLGADPMSVCKSFDVREDEEYKAFELNLARTGVAALTLLARTLRYDQSSGNWRGLDYEDVWLDKDAVLAPDGKLYFADLDGLASVKLAEEGIEGAIRKQFDKHAYEFFYALMAIERERQRTHGRMDWQETARYVGEMLRLAMNGDKHVQVEWDGGDILMLYTRGAMPSSSFELLNLRRDAQDAH